MFSLSASLPRVCVIKATKDFRYTAQDFKIYEVPTNSLFYVFY